jgi:hypothetical protein
MSKTPNRRASAGLEARREQFCRRTRPPQTARYLTAAAAAIPRKIPNTAEVFHVAPVKLCTSQITSRNDPLVKGPAAWREVVGLRKKKASAAERTRTFYDGMIDDPVA